MAKTSLVGGFQAELPPWAIVRSASSRLSDQFRLLMVELCWLPWQLGTRRVAPDQFPLGSLNVNAQFCHDFILLLKGRGQILAFPPLRSRVRFPNLPAKCACLLVGNPVSTA